MPSRVEDIATARQAVAELYHCSDAGPQWFTQGRAGQLSHAREWVRKANEALDRLEEVIDAESV